MGLWAIPGVKNQATVADQAPGLARGWNFGTAKLGQLSRESSNWNNYVAHVQRADSDKSRDDGVISAGPARRLFFRHGADPIAAAFQGKRTRHDVTEPRRIPCRYPQPLKCF